MANMSYCRFQNTSNDLADCVDWMESNADQVFWWVANFNGAKASADIEELACDEFDDEALSYAEARAMLKVLRLCGDVASAFSDAE